MHRFATIRMSFALTLGMTLAGAGVAYAGTPSAFATVSGPIGVAATPGRLLVTEYFTCNVVKIDSAGTVTPFATIPTGSCFGIERYIAVSPGLGGFTANDIYVTRGTEVWRITPDGSSVTLFTTIPSLAGTHSGITFDKVGTFGNDMIVTGFNAAGGVWRVSSAGVATHVADVGVGVEGPDVAPLSFGPLGGQVLVAAESTSEVYAVSSGGVVTLLADFGSTPVAGLLAAESTHVVPPAACSFGSSGGAFFTANFTSSQIYKFPTSDFLGLSGSALVTSESNDPTYGGIARIAWTGSAFAVTNFQTNIGQHEGSSFVECAVPGGGCVRTQGFWKNHASAWPVTSLTLGTTIYTQAQLLSILNQPVQGNGLVSLSHQLIAAKLNAASGASVPVSVQTAIASADALIGGLVVPPVGSGVLAPASTSALNTTLDQYNQGLTPGGPSHCE